MTFDWPPYLDDLEREMAVYCFIQNQVRFSGSPVLSRGISRWFESVPRPIRQRAYREFRK